MEFWTKLLLALVWQRNSLKNPNAKYNNREKKKYRNTYIIRSTDMQNTIDFGGVKFNGTLYFYAPNI